MGLNHKHPHKYAHDIMIYNTIQTISDTALLT